MPREKTTMPPTRRETETVDSADDPSAEGTSLLLEQAAAFGEIAAAAMADCNHGANAENELDKRRNQSGQ